MLRSVIVATVTAVALTGCASPFASSRSSADDEPRSVESTSEPKSDFTPDAEPGVPAPEVTDEATTKALEKLDVKGAFTDDVVGHKVQVLGAVRHFPFPEKQKFYADDSEMVLVNLKVTAGSKFYTSFYLSDLEIVSDEEGTRNSTMYGVESDIRKAGYKPLDDVDRGRTGTGWVAFRVEPKDSEKLTLRYVRDATKVIGTNKTIPAKNFDVPLVK